MQSLGFGDEGFDVAGVEVGQAGGQPVGVGVAEGSGQLGGEVVQVFAGVVEVNDRGGLRQDCGGQVPDPERAVAEDDELADVVGAAAAGLGVHQGGELGGGGEAAQVAGRVRVSDRPSVSTVVWVNRAASLTSRVRARPSGALPARPATAAATTGTPVPSTAT